MVVCYVSSPDDAGIMCRIHREKLTQFLSREREIDFILLLGNYYDFGPNVLLTFDNGFCYDYITGEPLNSETVQLDEVWRKIARQMAQMHSIDVPEKLQFPSKLYEFFNTPLERYPEKISNEKLNMRFRKDFAPREVFLKEQKNLEDEVDRLNIPCVFSHADSRPENMVWDKNSGKVTFVDFECCGYHSRAFDIAYHFYRYPGLKKVDFSKFPNEKFQRQWIKVYLEEYFLRTKRNADEITEVEIEKIRVEVKKTYLLILLLSSGGGALAMESKTVKGGDIEDELDFTDQKQLENNIGTKEMSTNGFAGLPHLSNTIRDDHLTEDLHEVLARVRPHWCKKEIKFKKLPNTLSYGVINIMVICYVSSPEDDGIMCRIHTDKFKEYFSHERELDFILLLRKHYDFAPNILLTFDNGFCYEYIIGEALTLNTVRLDQIWRKIAVQMAQMHSLDVPEKLQFPSKFFEFFSMPLEKYPEKMTDEKLNDSFQKNFPPRDLFLKEQKNMQDELDRLNIPCVFSHADSRPENMVWDKDSGKVTFIDFECCGYQSRAFDIAYHFFRYAGIKYLDFSKFPKEEFQRQWIKVYLEEYFLRTKKNFDDVMDVEIEKIRVEVIKTYLLILLLSAGGGPTALENKMINEGDLDIDLIDFSALCYKEYLRIKDDVMALNVPQ